MIGKPVAGVGWGGGGGGGRGSTKAPGYCFAVYSRLALHLFKALADVLHGENRMEWG